MSRLADVAELAENPQAAAELAEIFGQAIRGAAVVVPDVVRTILKSDECRAALRESRRVVEAFHDFLADEVLRLKEAGLSEEAAVAIVCATRAGFAHTGASRK